MKNAKDQGMDRHRYEIPVILWRGEILLERDILTASVVDDVAPVETSGQQINGIYDGTDTNVSSATFNYDWGE